MILYLNGDAFGVVDSVEEVRGAYAGRLQSADRSALTRWSRLARFHNEVMPSLDCGCFVSAEAEAAAYDLEMQKLQLTEADLDQFIQAKWSLAAESDKQAVVLTDLNEFGDIAWRVERR